MSRTRSIPPNYPAESWQAVLTRGFQMFAYYHWFRLKILQPSIVDDSTCITLRNAALESSLMSIRDLDDFFASSSGARADDMIATDFDFPAGRSFLTADERNAINKKLAHLTYQATTELLNDPLRQNPRTWNNADLVNRASKPLLEFLEHLEKSYFSGAITDAASIGSARKTILYSLKNLNALAVELDFPA